MTERYIIYCDESVRKGRYYSNFYGGALIKEKHREFIEARLQKVKDEQNIFESELKWTKITEHYEEKYKAFMEAYFDLVKEGHIKIRIMFRDNSFKPNLPPDPSLSPSARKMEGYFKLYYQFLKHAFGLRYHPNEEIIISVMLDRVPHRGHVFDEFRKFISQLGYRPEFWKQSISFPAENIADVDSKKHIIMQALDINLGAINFYLNDLQQAESKNRGLNAGRRGAKIRVYEFIDMRIREIYPNFNISMSTNYGSLENRWYSKYGHWRFSPYR